METNFAVVHDEVISRLRTELNLTMMAADERLQDFLRFLKMCAASSLPLAPTLAMDEVWHVLLRDEDRYRTLCLMVCDHIIGHEAGESDDAAKRVHMRRLSRVRARQMFGTDFAELWLQDGAASCCSSCSHVVVEYRASVP